jgi:hypothetical protein
MSLLGLSCEGFVRRLSEAVDAPNGLFDGFGELSYELRTGE